MSLYSAGISKLLCLMASSVVLIALAGCEAGKEVIRWDIQSQATASSTDYKELVKMTANINTMSAGRFVITAHPGGAITGGLSLIHISEPTRPY